MYLYGDGHAAFGAEVLEGLSGAQCIIEGLDMNLQQLLLSRHKEWGKGAKLLVDGELCGIILRNHLCSGANDYSFHLGSGHGLGTVVLFLRM